MTSEEGYKGLSKSELTSLMKMLEGDFSDIELGINILESLNLVLEFEREELYMTIYLYYRVIDYSWILLGVAPSFDLVLRATKLRISMGNIDKDFFNRERYERFNGIFNDIYRRRTNKNLGNK